MLQKNVALSTKKAPAFEGWSCGLLAIQKTEVNHETHIEGLQKHVEVVNLYVICILCELNLLILIKGNYIAVVT